MLGACRCLSYSIFFKTMTIIQDQNSDIDREMETDDDSIHSENEEKSNGTSGVENDNELFNSGWADSISKILKSHKPRRKKCEVLSRAKKLTHVKKKKSELVGFEIESVEGVESKDIVKTEVEEKEQSDERKRKRKKELLNIRVKPNILEKDRERTLQKIATKGVVQLFNAVKMQQKDISKKLKDAGSLEVRKEKVLKNIDKRAFLDVLMGEKSQKVDEKSYKQERESSKDSTWSVLRDDFMMQAKMKDWDKELETEGMEEEVESE